MKNKEIEIKIKLSKDEFDILEKTLATNAEFQRKTEQDDTYFQPREGSYICKDGAIYKWLRLRIENDRSILTFKHIPEESEDKSRKKDEYESIIEDPEQIAKIIKSMEYAELIRFKKIRSTYRYKNAFEVDLDYVSTLGYFVEIEMKEDYKSLLDAEMKIEKVLKELNIDLKNESVLGYAHLSLIKAGKAKVPKFAQVH